VKERLQGLSCSSAAATSVVPSNGRAIDRHSPHLRDPHRRLPPPVPKPPRPSSSFSTTKDSSSSYKQRQQICHSDVDGKDKRKNKKKKSTAAAAAGSGSSPSEHRRNGKEKALQLQQVSPASSSRFLLNSSRLMMQSDDETTAVDSLPPLPSPRRPSFVDAAAEDDTDTFPSSHGDAASPAVPSRRLQLVAPPLELFAEPSASGAGSSSSSSSEIAGGHVVAAADNTVVVRSCSTRTAQHQVRTFRPSSIVHDHRSMHVLTINYRVERCQRVHR
jgi:hypothetical protein